MPSKPDDKDPPTGEKPVGLVAGLAMLALVACVPVQWQASATAANAVADISNSVAYPALQRAYDDAGFRAVAASESRDDAELRLEIVRRQWAPVWDAWDAFARSHSAWLVAIRTEGDAIESGSAARDAYCSLRVAAWSKARLPDFPLPGLECAP